MRRLPLIVLLSFGLIGILSVVVGRGLLGDRRAFALCAVSFQGYSNSVEGMRFAIFAVTNRDVALEFRTEAWAIPATGSWTRVHSTLDHSTLPHGARCSVAVEAPTNQGNWIAQWLVIRKTLRYKLLMGLDKHSWSRPLIRPVLGRNSDIIAVVRSEWIPQ